MNLLAKLCNDEGFYYNHWIYIVPDEADDDELPAMQFGASSTSFTRRPVYWRRALAGLSLINLSQKY